MVSIEALLSFAVYLDDVTAYNYAINEWVNNPCAGATFMYEPTTGQSVESGRDQGLRSICQQVASRLTLP